MINGLGDPKFSECHYHQQSCYQKLE
jgi:hypothetical protein